MAHLTPEQNRIVASFLREYAQLHRELTAAKVLLQYCQQNKVYPHNFQSELDKMGEKIFEPLEIIAAHVEQSSDQIEFGELLAKFPRRPE